MEKKFRSPRSKLFLDHSSTPTSILLISKSIREAIYEKTYETLIEVRKRSIIALH